MGLNKKDREKFERQLRKRMLLYPRDVHKEQFSLFEEDEPDKYVHMEFMLHYPEIGDKNPNPHNNPVPKQSMRTRIGYLKNTIGFTFDKKPIFQPIVHNHPDPYLVKISEALVMQIRQTMEEEYPGLGPFTKEVHVTRFEAIFHYTSDFSKRDIELAESGKKIFFKTTKPDLDNIQKMVWDSMQEAGVFPNDAQICSHSAVVKRYGDVAGVIIEIECEK
jgi:hypothetical protein